MDTQIRFASFIKAAVERNAPFVSILDKGISEERIYAVLSKISIVPNKQILNLYSWANGIILKENTVLGEVFFGIFGVLMSIEQSVDEYSYINDNNILPQNFFPIFVDDYHLLNLEEDDFVYLYSEDLDISEPTTIYDSLDSMLETLTCAHKLGFITYKNNLFDCDYSAYRTLAKKINKNSSYWKK